MPLIIWGDDYNFIIKVFEPTKSLKVVVSVDPSVRETNCSHDVEIIEFFVAVDAVTPGINHYYILMREIQKLLQALIWRTSNWLLNGTARSTAP